MPLKDRIDESGCDLCLHAADCDCIGTFDGLKPYIGLRLQICSQCEVPIENLTELLRLNGKAEEPLNDYWKSRRENDHPHATE